MRRPRLMTASAATACRGSGESANAMMPGKMGMANVEQIRQAALAKVRENALDAAIELFDEALALAEDDDMLDLLTINKAGVLIDMEKDGPEVQKLPQLVMRRRSPKHTFLAAFHLQAKYSLARDFKRAYNYGRIALDVSAHVEERWWKVAVLIDMGNACVYDSRFQEAIERYREVLSMPEPAPEHALNRGCAMQNLGYCLIHEGELEPGLELIHQATALFEEAGAPHYAAAERYIDLCYGYLELDKLDEARRFGEMGLELATEVRQVRNAHYLLGEVAYKQGEISSAEAHFELLAKHYPDFPQIKNVLMAIDLRGIVNWKL